MATSAGAFDSDPIDSNGLCQFSCWVKVPSTTTQNNVPAGRRQLPQAHRLPPYVAGTYFTIEEYDDLALRLAVGACAVNSYRSRGAELDGMSRQQIMSMCEKKLAAFDRSK
ncbi:MAG TPA: hypothetical protein VFM56_06360 [Solimonas sp.]|nr:hypothetical protein [Solimonas sp.]